MLNTAHATARIDCSNEEKNKMFYNFKIPAVYLVNNLVGVH